jgi:VanZ family protein
VDKKVSIIPVKSFVQNRTGLKKFLPILIRLPAVCAAALIWFLSSQTILPKPKGILGFDKLQHLLAFAVFTGAVCLWISREKWRIRGPFFMLIAAAAGSVYGIVDEVHQYFVPGRDCNVWDWIADTLGSVIGAAVFAGLMNLAARYLLKGGRTV